MSKERDTIRHISWRDLFPWLILFRTFGVAIGVQVLLLAAAGAVATSAVWWVNGKIFFLGEAPAVTDAGEFKAPDTTGMEREEAEAAKARANKSSRGRRRQFFGTEPMARQSRELGGGPSTYAACARASGGSGPRRSGTE